MEFALKKGAKTQLLDILGRSPLYYALEYNDAKTIEWVLNVWPKAGLVFEDRFGDTLLDAVFQNPCRFNGSCHEILTRLYKGLEGVPHEKFAKALKQKKAWAEMMGVPDFFDSLEGLYTQK